MAGEAVGAEAVLDLGWLARRKHSLRRAGNRWSLGPCPAAKKKKKETRDDVTTPKTKIAAFMFFFYSVQQCQKYTMSSTSDADVARGIDLL